MANRHELAELAKVRNEQVGLQKKLEVAATAITRSRVELHREGLSPDEIKNAKLEQRFAELEAAGIQRQLEAAYSREELLMNRNGLGRRPDERSQDRNAGAERVAATLHREKDELTQAREDVAKLKERIQDSRVDQTYTKRTLETAERELEAIQQRNKGGRSL